ncbi:MAG: filamentous hemagglutinin N-terminal domain-containing protein, partial [Candidatus Omnitrophica bacterium]|nr:filamentous hemagglutinin N-terminal domain-containing protein [Candidatus Omnitrophota bacterium]
MKRYFKLLSLSFILMGCGTFMAYAENPQVISGGSITVSNPSQNKTVVSTSTVSTILGYNNFSVPANQSYVFDQPSVSSRLLIRSQGSDPSLIYGSLSSNGALFLVNLNGIIFGPHAQVNAPAVLASTLDITNEDFLKGNYKFFKNGPNASIVNQGRIAAQPGGFVALLSQAVSNQGVILADLGTVALASGNQMTLALDSLDQISVVVDEAVQSELIGLNGQKVSDAISNTGTIEADGGKVILTAKIMNDLFDHAVNNNGVVQAASLANNDGTIEMVASGAPVVNSGTMTSSGALSIKAQGGINSTGSLISAGAMTLLSDGDIYSQGILESATLYERGNTFKIGGTFYPGVADVKNADNAIVYTNDTNVYGTISDAGNIEIAAGKTLTMTGDTIFNAGSEFLMDSTGGTSNFASIIGDGKGNYTGSTYNLTISAGAASTLGNISGVNILELESAAGSNVIFTSPTNATFSVLTVKTDYSTGLGSSAVLSRDKTTTISAATYHEIFSDSDAPGGLAYINDSVNNPGGLALKYILENNIDATETQSWHKVSGTARGFTPIGTIDNSFSGTFDGYGHTISNLYIVNPAAASLFTDDATIAGGTWDGVTITGGTFHGADIGLFGVTSSTALITSSATSAGVQVPWGLTNVTITATTPPSSPSFPNDGSYFYRGVGALVGLNNGTVEYSYVSSGTVKGNAAVGTDTTKNTYYMQGDELAGFTGGLVGLNYGQISYANTGSSLIVGNSTTPQGSIVGGLVGASQGCVSATGCGSAYVARISDSYSQATVYGGDINYYDNVQSDPSFNSSTGGLVGQLYDNTDINHSYATGAVNGGGTVGGLVGKVSISDQPLAAITISYSFATGNVTNSNPSSESTNGSSAATGGLVGAFSGTSILSSYATGTVSGGYSIAGGFVGEFSGLMNYSYSTGDVSGRGDMNIVGGLVGYNGVDGSSAIIQNSYSIGNATEQNESSSDFSLVGGFVGLNDGEIDNSYAKGNVTVTQDTGVTASNSTSSGGFVGATAMGNDSLIVNSFSMGVVTGGAIAGGFIGYNDFGPSALGQFIGGNSAATSTITNCAWYKTGSGINGSSYGATFGAAPVITGEQTLSNFSSSYNVPTITEAVYASGSGSAWDFTNKWTWSTISHYPILKIVDPYFVPTNFPSASSPLTAGPGEFSSAPKFTAVYNAWQDTYSSYALSANITSSDTGNGTDKDTGFLGTGSITAVSGVVTLSTSDYFKTTGTQTITVTDSTNADITGMTASYTVNPAAAYKATVSNTGGTTNLTVKTKDTYGNQIQSVDTGSQTLVLANDIPAGVTLNTLIFNLTSGNTAILGSSITLNGSLKVYPGSTLDPGTYTINCNKMDIWGKILVNTATFAGNYFYSGAGSTLVLEQNSLYTTGGPSITGSGWLGSMVVYQGASQTVLAVPYDNLVISGSGTTTLAGTLSVTNFLKIGSSATLDPGSYSISGNPGGTSTGVIDIYGTVLVRTSIIDSDYTSFAAAYLESGSTINYAGSVAQIIDSTLPYYNLSVTGTSAAILRSVSVSNSLTVGSASNAASILDPTSAYTISGTNLYNYGTINVDAATFGGNYSFTNINAETGTVNYAGTGAQTINHLTPYYNLSVTGSGGAALDGAIAGLHTLTIGGVSNSASSLDPVSSANTISGTNFSDYGTIKVYAATFAGSYNFTNATTLGTSSTVNYAGTNQTIDHNLSYAYLTTSGSGTKTLNGTTTVGKDLIVGASTDISGDYALTVSGNGMLNGTIGHTASLASFAILGTGTTNINSSEVKTVTSSGGTQTYSGPVVLGADATLTGNGITFADTISSNSDVGGHSLTIHDSGTTTFQGSIGDQNALLNPLSSLSVTAAHINFNISTAGGNIETIGNQTYTGPVNLGDSSHGDYFISDNTGAIDFEGTVNGGEILYIAGPLSSAVGVVTFNGAVGNLTPVGGVNITASEIDIKGGLVATVLSSGSGNSYNGPIVLYADTTFTTGQEIDFQTGSTINSVSSTPYKLTIVDSTKPVFFFESLGATHALGGIDITAGSGSSGDDGINFDGHGSAISVVTNGDQIYRGDVNLNGNTTLLTSGHNVDIKGKVGLTEATAYRLYIGKDNSGADYDLTNVTFEDTVTGLSGVTVGGAAVGNGGTTTIYKDITTTGTHEQDYWGPVVLMGSVTLNAGTGASGLVDFGHAVNGNGFALNIGTSGTASNAMFEGTVSSLSSLTVYGTTITNSSITTTGTQTYTGAVTLIGSLVTFTAGGAGVSFGSTVNGAAPATDGLSILGKATFNGVVGATSLLSLAVSGATTINTTAITTSGDQSYGALTVGANTNLTASGATGVTFNSTVDGSVAATYSLTVTGKAVFNGIVGATTLTTLSVTSTTTINTTAITTSGNQSYGALTVSANTNLTSNGGTGVTFNSTVDGSIAATYSLTVTGKAVFDGIVGTTSLAGLSVSGATTIAATGITTSGNQSYGALTVGANTNLTASGATGVTFNSTVDGASAATYSLTVTGKAVFDGIVGATTLTTLSVTGATTIATTAITTSGNQSYGAVTVGANTNLTSNGGTGVTFNSTVDGSSAATYSLTVTGKAVFDGIVGTTSLAGLSVSGATMIATTGITTSGNQSYGALTVGANTNLTASGATGVTFNSTVDGASAATYSLTVTGKAVFDGIVGATTLTTLSVTGATTIATTAITTSGNQSYGAVTVGANTNLTSNGGTGVTFNSTVDGSSAATYSLTVTGKAVFDGIVGTTSLAGLSVSGATMIATTGITTSGNQ